MNNPELNNIRTEIKSGNEELVFNSHNTGYSVLDFWRWSVSDLMSNATRGRFAEFIVAIAVNNDFTKPRDEWAAFDVSTAEGIKIEVKSSAYIQSWHQKRLSSISFSIKPARQWDSEKSFSDESKVRSADIYVFCLLKHKDKSTVNPLLLEQWAFFVLPTFKLDNYTRSQTSITLKSLEKISDPVRFAELKEKIYSAYQEQLNSKSDFK